jgi:acyl carrier protein
LKVYLLDRRMNLMPVRVAGELHISGVGLARGYINRPQLTAEKFIPNPFSNKAGDRLYRTGDLARHLQDGRIEFLGRIDQQVKIRGFRVELGEIEAALEQSQLVKKAVVVAREDAQGGKRLVAYIILETPGEQIVTQLRDSLKEVLADYMIPSAFVMMKEFAFTPNGKLDRLKLPSPEQASIEEFVPPSTPTEERIAKIWAEVLGLPGVGVHNTFFDLGGHSLIATEIVSRMRVEFGVGVTVRTLFDTPTVAGLAEIISREEPSKPDTHASDMIPRRSRSIEDQLGELDELTTEPPDHSRLT